MEKAKTRAPRPPKSSRKMVVRGGTWWWVLSGLDNIVLWSPTGKKMVVPHYPVTLRTGDDIERAQRKQCGPEVGAITPKNVRDVIDSLVLGVSQSIPR